MEVKDMSKAERNRLSKIKYCSICGGLIADWHDVQIIKYRSGKFMNYNFFHTECLEQARKEIGRV